VISSLFSSAKNTVVISLESQPTNCISVQTQAARGLRAMIGKETKHRPAFATPSIQGSQRI